MIVVSAPTGRGQDAARQVKRLNAEAAYRRAALLPRIVSKANPQDQLMGKAWLAKRVRNSAQDAPMEQK